MSNYEIVVKYRNEQMTRIVSTLQKTSELIAFIRVYGSLYDDYYNSFILNINNLIEHYLENFDSEFIDKLYGIYYNLRDEGKLERDIFEQLGLVLYKLPAFAVTETSARRLRHK